MSTAGRPRGRITGPMLAALQRLADGRSLRGWVHASSYWALVRMRLIEDADTITEAGRQAVARRAKKGRGGAC